MLTRRPLAMPITALLIVAGAILPGSSSGVPERSIVNYKLSRTLEGALPTVLVVGDYWTASKLSFQLAKERARLNETAASCDALTRSLDYYRRSVGEPAARGTTADRASGADGLEEIRSTFGCTTAQFG
jgi:hypothetical protein